MAPGCREATTATFGLIGIEALSLAAVVLLMIGVYLAARRRGPSPTFSPTTNWQAALVHVGRRGYSERSEEARMSASTNNLVRVFTEEELEARKSEVIDKLERRFGSLERALEREEDWNYDDEEAALFSEYHTVAFLLSD